MIKVLYKCYCMKDEASILVPERPDGADLGLWMQVLQGTIGMDHNLRSPTCQSSTMEYVKIPFDDGAEQIGSKPKLN